MHRQIPILLYHSVSTQASPRFCQWTVHPRQFTQHLDYLVQQGYTPLTVSQLVRAISHPDCPLPAKPVTITFDDGFADFSEQALPALRRRGFPSTLYVTTAYVGGTARWLASEGEGDRRMLTWRQIVEAARQGTECGAHSRTHRRLDELPVAQARGEIEGSKAELEDRLGIAVETFAYPHGCSSPTVRDLVKEAGFSSACAVRHALSSHRDDAFSLARVVVSGATDMSALAKLLQGRGIPTAPLPERLRTKTWRTARRALRLVRAGP